MRMEVVEDTNISKFDMVTFFGFKIILEIEKYQLSAFLICLTY